MKWTEAAVVDVLRRTYSIGEDTAAGRRWSMLTQVPHAGRIIDVLLVDTSGWRLAMEIKCSRADFRSETDAKRAASESLAYECYYVAPAGLLRGPEMPRGWGLIEVGTISHYRDLIAYPMWPASVRRTPAADPLLTHALRRASDAEEAIRRGDTSAAQVAALRAENARLAAAAERAHIARDRERQRAMDARSELLSLAGSTECADCDGQVTWQRGGPRDRTWVHVDATAERRCQKARADAWRRARQAAVGAAYLGGYAAPVEPRAIRDALDATVATTTRKDPSHA